MCSGYGEVGSRLAWELLGQGRREVDIKVYSAAGWQPVGNAVFVFDVTSVTRTSYSTTSSSTFSSSSPASVCEQPGAARDDQTRICKNGHPPFDVLVSGSLLSGASSGSVGEVPWASGRQDVYSRLGVSPPP